MRITHRIAGPQDRAGRGCRQALHPTDVRIEARGPTREECIAEAVRGLVDSFAVVAGRPPHTWAERHVRARRDEDLLVAVIDEVIYWINADGELPVSAAVQPASDGGAVVFLAFVRAADAKIIGAVPKAASARDLRCVQDPDGQWACAVTLEV